MLPEELTEEEIKLYEEKAAQIAKSKNISKVHPVVLIDQDTMERRVCYLTEPNYLTKIRVMDKAATHGVYTAGDELRQACLVREESDPITYGESPECDRYKLGVTDFAISLVRRLQNQFKKK
jgi:hypothetical protein